MKQLLESIERLKETDIKKVIEARIKEFKETGKKPSNEIFKELCFCILTANFSAERSIKIQDEIGEEFLTLEEPELAKRLRELGHRYPNTRARYIVEARKYKDSLKNIIRSFGNGYELREWMVKNIKGIGYKEASHFLRNIGYENLAIIDFHIFDILIKHGMIKNSKTLTKRRYLEIENTLRRIAKRLNLSLAELDLYLWFSETGKVLK